jgi:hypothetical protein
MLPLIHADFANYLDVLDRSEIQLNVTHAFPGQAYQGGNLVQTAGGTTLGINFFTQPVVRYRATNRRWEFTLGYLPSLTVTDVELGSGAGTLFLQEGQAGVAWIPVRHLTIAVNEDATYGQFNAGVLLPTVAPVAAGATAPAAGTGAQPNAGTGPPPVPPGNTATNPTPVMPGNPLQAQPQPQKVTIVTSHTAGNVGIQINRQAHVGFGGGYFTSGGLGVSSQEKLPLQYGPSANANFTYALGRRDFLITGANAYQAQFTSVDCAALRGQGIPGTAFCRPLDQFATLTQGYQHNIERNTALTTQAGVSLVRERDTDGDPFRSVWFPTGLVSVAHKSGTKGLVTTGATLALAPAVNALTGAVTNFITLQATLAEPVAAKVLLHAIAGGGQGYPPDSQASSTIVQGEVGVAYVLSKRVTLEVGQRAFWQRAAVVPGLNATGMAIMAPPGAVAFADFFAEVTYFAVTVGAPELRF